MEQRDRLGITAVLTAHAEFQLSIRLASTLCGNLHQLPDAVLVDGVERIPLQQSELEITRHHTTFHVVTTQAERHLREIVRAEAEEVRVFRKMVGTQRGPRRFDHGSNGDMGSLGTLACRGVSRKVGELAQHTFDPASRQCQLVGGDGEGNHHFHDRLESLAGNLFGCLHQCPHLHCVQPRLHDPEPHTAGTQHGVDFRPLAGCVQQLGFFDGETRGALLHFQLVHMREELMQRRVEQSHGDRQAAHRTQDSDEVLFLRFAKFFECRSFVGWGVGQDHSPHHGKSIRREEHVLGAAQADSFGAE